MRTPIIQLLQQIEYHNQQTHLNTMTFNKYEIQSYLCKDIILSIFLRLLNIFLCLFLSFIIFGLMSGRKRRRLNQKKKQRYNQDIKLSSELILKGQATEAVSILKSTILSGMSLNIQEFYGWGNRQNWNQCFRQGPAEWFNQFRDLIRNPFDLLSVAFMMGLHTHSIQFNEIIAIYQQLRSQISQDMYELYMGLGNAYYNNNQFFRAEEQYLKALQLKQTQKVCEYIAWIRGFAFGHCGIQPITMPYVQKCLKINPKNKWAQLLKAVYREKNEQILQEVNKLIIQYPQYYRLHLELAFQTEDHEQKVRLCDRALEFDPNYIHAFVFKAIWMQKYNPVEAEALLELAKLKFSDSAFLWNKMADRQVQRQNNEKALQYLHRSLKLNPYRFRVYEQIAKIYSDSNPQKALMNFEKYIELNPYNSWLYNRMAICHYNLKRHNQQLNCYLKGLQHHPKNETILKNIANFYSRKNHRDALKAASYFERLFQVEPSAQICLRISKSYGSVATTELLQTIKKWAFKCLQLGGDSEKQVYKYISDIYIVLQQYDKSIQWFLRAACERGRLANAEQFIQNLKEQIQEHKIITFLRKHLQPEVKQENIYWFLQLMRLFQEMNEIRDALICQNKIKSIVQGKDSLQSLIRVSIRPFFFTNGILEEDEQVNLIIVMDQYSENFTQLYS